MFTSVIRRYGIIFRMFYFDEHVPADQIRFPDAQTLIRHIQLIITYVLNGKVMIFGKQYTHITLHEFSLRRWKHVIWNKIHALHKI